MIQVGVILSMIHACVILSMIQACVILSMIKARVMNVWDTDICDPISERGASRLVSHTGS